MIGAGAMNRPITIQQAAVTKDATGAPQKTWSTFAAVWAKREDLGGYEYWQARQISAERQTRFTIRYVAGVRAEMRVDDSGLVFDIKSVGDPDGRGATMVLNCEAKV